MSTSDSASSNLSTPGSNYPSADPALFPTTFASSSSATSSAFPITVQTKRRDKWSLQEEEDLAVCLAQNKTFKLAYRAFAARVRLAFPQRLDPHDTDCSSAFSAWSAPVSFRPCRGALPRPKPSQCRVAQPHSGQGQSLDRSGEVGSTRASRRAHRRRPRSRGLRRSRASLPLASVSRPTYAHHLALHLQHPGRTVNGVQAYVCKHRATLNPIIAGIREEREAAAMPAALASEPAPSLLPEIVEA